MIFYLLLSILLFVVSMEIGKMKEQFAPLASKGAMAISVIFLLWWAYVYLYIPYETSVFYNNGAGTSWVDPSSGKNLTIYNNSDERVLYSFAYQQNEVWLVDMIKNWAWLVGVLSIGGYGAWWVWSHNLSGSKIR